MLRSHTWRTVANSAAYLAPSILPNMKVLDVGCGPGTITVDFALLVPQGHVTGIDRSADALDQARKTSDERGIINIVFQQGDIHALPFKDNTFDLVHAHQVLQHVVDPVLALKEMRRVTKPGGIVAARDADFSAMTWYPPVSGVDDWRTLYMRVARGNGGEPDAGRRLHAWARQAGFERDSITTSAGTWCGATPERRAWWSKLWADRTVAPGYAKIAIDSGYATSDDLQRISQAWHDWSAEEDGWFVVLHGEIICRVN